MATTFTELVASTLAPYAQAIKAGANGGEKFQLPVQARQMLADNLNNNNPLLWFSNDIKAQSIGAGSVEITYNEYTDIWTEKTAYGAENSAFNDVTLKSEFFKWNKPLKAQEAITAHDVKRGVPNVLAQRVATNLTKFIQSSIKNGFQKFADGLFTAGKKETFTIPNASDTTQEKGAKLSLFLTQAATRLITKAQIAKERVTIIVNAIQFDTLAFAGLIGNRAEMTFAGGQYSTGIVGGYRIVSGEMFLPDLTKSTTKKADVWAIIGTSDSFVYSNDVIAANVERLAPTNDNGSYLEVADIAAMPARTVAQDHAVVVVSNETNVTP